MNPTNAEDAAVPAALTDPARTERVGTAISARLGDLGVSVVVCWDTSEDTVLAHVVARELDVPLGLAVEVEGIVSLLQSLPPAAQVALVADRFHAPNGLAGLAGVVRHAGGTIVAVASATGEVAPADTAAADARIVRPDAG